MERDAKRDLTICDKATLGPLEVVAEVRPAGPMGMPSVQFYAVISKSAIERHGSLAGQNKIVADLITDRADAVFFAEAREALPHWIQRAEAAESRVKELEQTVVDMRDRVILERERREQAEAACAAMRKALESIADWNDDRSPEGIYRAIEIADQALSTTAGRDYVERLKKLELVAEAVREYRDYAWKPYNHRTFSQEVLGSLKKRVCDSLTALDGDGNG